MIGEGQFQGQRPGMRIVAHARDGSHFALRSLVDGEILLITAGEEGQGQGG